MTGSILASRSFRPDDQRRFAQASGDFNPMHLDPDFARRTQMGAPVVHGIHTLLWALDAAQRSEPFDLGHLKVRFHQPLYLGEAADVVITARTSVSAGFEVMMDGILIATIKASSLSGKVTGSAARSVSATLAPLSAAADPSFEQMARQSGAVRAPASDDDLRQWFPALAQSAGTSTLRALLATSQIVGMACPGLHSLFTGLDLNRDAASDGERTLRYAVTKADPRFRALQIEVADCGIVGRIEAFARHAPPRQPDMAAVRARVRARAFDGRRALVIGGSRGLGEVTAKIIGAGGGHVLLTYRDGKPEAERVAAEIRNAGGSCDILRYDALAPASDQLADIGAIDSCYYFATSRIFERKLAETFSPQRLRRHLSYTTDAFHALCSELAARASAEVAGKASSRIGIFYPSTVAIDTEASGIAEYAMAKAAGETLAKYLNASLPHVQIVSHRLPRILTDQTATVGAAVAHDPLDVLLPIVYEIEQIGRP
jgi:acyl dehydratase/NAD(P)-dependent dehydrogenase (short-subunit alcohol dehydrogenase family)